jgi:RimJ/RimL family protein N-acetyltransferase
MSDSLAASSCLRNLGTKKNAENDMPKQVCVTSNDQKARVKSVFRAESPSITFSFMKAPKGPAYRIETARTRLRCYAPTDFAALSEAISLNLDHLRPWMPWVLHEPVGDEKRIAWLRTQRGHFDLDGDYFFGIFSKDESKVLGGAGLKMVGDVDEREVGYWIHRACVGQGLATEVTAAMVRVGFEIEQLSTITIRVLPDNLPSARVPQKLGFSGPVCEANSLPWPGEGKRDGHAYSLSRAQYAASPARNVEIAAFDVLDRPLPLSSF